MLFTLKTDIYRYPTHLVSSLPDQDSVVSKFIQSQTRTIFSATYLHILRSNPQRSLNLQSPVTRESSALLHWNGFPFIHATCCWKKKSATFVVRVRTYKYMSASTPYNPFSLIDVFSAYISSYREFENCCTLYLKLFSRIRVTLPRNGPWQMLGENLVEIRIKHGLWQSSIPRWTRISVWRAMEMQTSIVREQSNKGHCCEVSAANIDSVVSRRNLTSSALETIIVRATVLLERRDFSEESDMFQLI